MAKIALSKIDIVNTATGGKLSYMATQTPWQSNVGHVWLQGPNAQGVAELQAKGFPVYCEEDWNALIKKTFGLSENSVGNRGPAWSTPEDREKYKVYINDVEYNPAFSTKALERAKILAEQKKAKAEAIAIAATQVVTPTIVTQTPQVAVADTTIVPTFDRTIVLGKVKQAVEAKHPKETILTALCQKMSMAQALEIYNEATLVNKPTTFVPIF